MSSSAEGNVCSPAAAGSAEVDGATADRRKFMKRSDTPSPADMAKNIARVKESHQGAKQQMRMAKAFTEEEEEEE